MTRTSSIVASRGDRRHISAASASPRDIDPLGVAIEVVLIAIIVFAPFPFGSVEAWSQEILIAGAGLAAALWTLRLFARPQNRLVLSLSYVPIALFFLLAIFQLMPLPVRAVQWLSPQTVYLKHRLLSDLRGQQPSRMMLSFYGWGTRFNLRLMVAVASLFVVTINTIRRSAQIKRLLGAIAFTTGAVAALALAQDLTGTTKVFWTVPDQYLMRATAGPFIHYNSFCQFMNLGLGATLGLALILLGERESHRYGRMESRQFDLLLVALGAVFVAGIAAVVLSLSRGGVLALSVSGLLTLVLLRGRLRAGRIAWAAGLAVLLAGGLAALLGIQGFIERMATLHDPMGVSLGRWNIMKDVLHIWTQFPLLGIGLGAHEWVYPRYISFPYTFNYTHAENEYAQMLEETGIVGFAIIVLFLLTIARDWLRGVRQGHRSVHAALFGLFLGVLAVLLQSIVDFGQHLLADASLLAVELGLIVVLGLKVAQSGKEELPADTEYFTPFPVRLLVAALVLLGFGWALPKADTARRSEAAYEAGRTLGDVVEGRRYQVGDSVCDDLLAVSGKAARIDPSNALYAYWNELYRWNVLTRNHDPNLPDDAFSPADLKTARQILDDLNRTRRLCVTFGLPTALAGSIGLFTLDDPRYSRTLELGYESAPNNPWVGEAALQMYGSAGRDAEALAVCRHYLTLKGVPPPPIAPQNLSQILVHSCRRVDLALKMAGDDPDRLFELANVLYQEKNRPDLSQLAAATREKARTLLKAQLEVTCAGRHATGNDLATLAEIYRDENQLDRAVEYYRRALLIQYEQVDWRLNLARVYLRQGRADDARQAAEVVLHLQPANGPANDVIAQARRLPVLRPDSR